MKLKKLEILGFKSFADKTALAFHPGITAIVGPNGCGKSNIADAFRWVLGEQSAKSMRGGKMPDVIFSGTSSRKPINLCEVTLTLTDVGENLPINYEEVSVARRLYRSGESDYLINRSPVRLKDLNDLFLDTGIGKNAFSIFEQGKLDQIIQLSPLERRYIFEEAAGILRFLQRKKEALRHLEQTEANGERIKDIHHEVARRMEVLKEQAEKASIYKEAKDRLETLEASLAWTKWNALGKKRESLNQKERQIKNELETLQRELQKLEICRQNTQFQLGHFQKNLDIHKENLSHVNNRKELKVKEVEICKLRINESRSQASEWQKEIEEAGKKRQFRQKEIEEALEQTDRLEAECKRLEFIRKEKSSEVQALEAELNKLREQHHEAAKIHLHSLQKEKEAESAIKQNSLKLEHNAERTITSLHRHTEAGKILEELKQDIDQKTAELAENSTHAANENFRLELIEKQLQEIDRQNREAQKDRHALDRKTADFSAREKILTRLRNEMEGFSKGAKELLLEAKRPQSPLFNKVQGLYELFNPMAELEKAVSFIMRQYAQTLAVHTAEDFDLVIAFADKKGIKDFSLFCLSTTKEAPLLKHPFAEDGPLTRHFLKGIEFADNRERALKTGSLSIWSNEGIFVDEKGVVFFIAEEKSGIFSREAELKSLKKELNEIEKAKILLDEAIKALTQKQGQLESHKKAAAHTIRSYELKNAEIKTSMQKLQLDLQKQHKELEKNHTESLSLEQVCSSLKQQLLELNRTHLQAAALTAENSVLADHLKEHIASVSQELKKQQADFTHITQAYHTIENEKKKNDYSLTIIKMQNEQSLDQENRLKKEIEAAQQKQHLLENTLVDCEQSIKECERELKTLHVNTNDKEKEMVACSQEIKNLEESIKLNTLKIKQQENELNGNSIQAAQIETSLQAIEHDLHHRFHLNIDDQMPGLPDHEMEQAEKKIKTLRNQIETAGAINMASIEEFDACRERHAFLTRQLDDLAISKKDLLDIITQLDSKSRKIFKETFEQIRHNFNKNFQILFLGGESDLILTETSNVLEAGIEITAKPPGKQMRSITLMSGGEKCLTAIALLFAIFEIKPAPFCILDEIDAPLDDGNIERFVNVIKQFTDRCQFIIITHNKRTMAIADRIFGVTMQEKGVSKIISLQFSEESKPEIECLEHKTIQQ